jgi:hypothetical protein
MNGMKMKVLTISSNLGVATYKVHDTHMGLDYVSLYISKNKDQLTLPIRFTILPDDED